MISVCIATYNGERFIREQMESILPQLSADDEVIISDDGSTDATLSIIESLRDSRIKVYRNSFKDVVKNFEFALNEAKGGVIFLSDQDDIWFPNKVTEILKIFQSDNTATLVLTNAVYMSDNQEINNKNFFIQPPPLKFISNIIKNNFLGCTMAFRDSFKDKIFPFPQNLAMHDWWIGLNHIRYGKIYFIDQPLVKYRRHDNTVTTGKRSSINNALKWRMDILKNIFIR